MLQCSVAKVGLNRGAVLLPAGLLPGCPAPACTWASGHGLLATVGMGQIVGARVMVQGICMTIILLNIPSILFSYRVHAEFIFALK